MIEKKLNYSETTKFDFGVSSIKGVVVVASQCGPGGSGLSLVDQECFFVAVING